MLKICPKCNHTFESCADDIANCHCYFITMESNNLALLKDEFDDCLCGVCLMSLAAKTHNQL